MVEARNSYVENKDEAEIVTSCANEVFYDRLKRLVDILLCVAVAPLGIVIVAITSLFIIAESRGGVFYKQERLGKKERKFMLYKLRSMAQDAERNGATWALKNDPRVTRVGRFIRKTRIDEIPQLINIIRGDMTIVGPRPEREVFYNAFEEQGLPYRNRLCVVPGLTGFAQVNGGYDMSPEEKLEWDMNYVDKKNFRTDMAIMFKTVGTIFTGEGAR